MIVNHPNRLHEGVADGRTDKCKPAFAKVPAHVIRHWRTGRYFLERSERILDGHSMYKLPDIRVKCAIFLLHVQESTGVVNGGVDLEAIAHDTRICQQTRNILLGIASDHGHVELVERLAVVVTFGKNRIPTQASLRALQDQEFK